MKRVDVAIIGSGFSGSILARVLATRGATVAIVDPQTHPRFAIGESSTPIADAILRRIGERFGLDDLVSMSSWGSWRREQPSLDCGLKRGFSYFAHRVGKPFQESHVGQRSLLATASANDDVADTHWYRPDVDSHLFQRAIESGVIDASGCSVVEVQSIVTKWKLTVQGKQTFQIKADWVIDASGQASVLAKLLELPNLVDSLRTRTHSAFGHFSGVRSWSRDYGNIADPFDSDNAAQHHLLGNGWLWMLRFASGITSVGFTAPLDHPLNWPGFSSIHEMMKNAKLVAPNAGMRLSGRLQRRFNPIVGPGAVMLPTAAVTLDPLHSTGIAHGLAGVERVADRILQPIVTLRRYAEVINREIELLDRMVSTAYTVMDDFPRFTAACMLYFAGAIGSEERMQRGEVPTMLWNADDDGFVAMVEKACRVIEDRSDDDFENRVREMIAPWNTAGLMNSDVNNRYVYTATKQAN